MELLGWMHQSGLNPGFMEPIERTACPSLRRRDSSRRSNRGEPGTPDRDARRRSFRERPLGIQTPMIPQYNKSKSELQNITNSHPAEPL